MYDPGAPACDPAVLSLGVPVLGICYGLQWIAHTLGGRVQRAERREYGPADLELRDGSPLFAGFPKRLKIWMSHGDNVLELPPGFHLTGATGNSLSAAEDPPRRIFAVQFHPEVRHTERGTEILRNFVVRHLRRAARIGAARPSSPRPWKPSASKWGRNARSVRSAEAWTPPSRRRWCIAPSATG